MKTVLVSVFALALLAGCSGHIAPPEVKFGKKCSEGKDGNVVYSYVWMHKQGEELTANKETCELLAD